MKMKKVLSLILALLMVVSLFATIAINVSADNTVCVESVYNLGKRTKAKYLDEFTEMITYTNNDVLEKSFDGDISTSIFSNNLVEDYTPSVKFDTADGEFVVDKTYTVNEPNTYYDVIIFELSSTSVLDNLTIWGTDDKASEFFMNDAFDIYYSVDGETFVYVDGVEDMCGDGSEEGENSDEAYYTYMLDDDTYYGVNFDMNGVTASYVALAVSKIAKGSAANGTRVVLNEITFNNAEQIFVQDGDLLHEVDFGATDEYKFIDGRGTDWNLTNPQVSADGKSVTVEYTDTVRYGKLLGTGRARYSTEKLSKLDIVGKSYTVQFTIDSEAYVGVHLDGNTGFIINPSLNSTMVGQSYHLDLIEDERVYDGTGASKQTYAIEVMGGTEVYSNNGGYDAYWPLVYRLYVLDEVNDEWRLIRELDLFGISFFEWEVGYSNLYISIARYGADEYNFDENGNPVTSTVSDMKIYRGINFIKTGEEAMIGQPDQLTYMPYDDAVDGDLIYKANFTGDEYWQPNRKKGAALAEREDVTGSNLYVLPWGDYTCASYYVWKDSHTFFGDEIEGFPLGEGYNYTVTFTMATYSYSEGFGLLIDGKTGGYFSTVKGRLQQATKKLGDDVFYEGGRLIDQKFAIEINEYTVSIYVNAYGEWLKLDEVTLDEFASENLCLTLYSYYAIYVDIYDLDVYKGLMSTLPDDDEPVDLYEFAEEGELLYVADFEDYFYWNPSSKQGALLAGRTDITSDYLTVTPDFSDSTKANITNEYNSHNLWGGELYGLPIGEGYDYTIKFTVDSVNYSERGIGLLVDGQRGIYVRNDKGRLQKTTGKWSDEHDYISYNASMTDQEYAAEVNGYTVSLYVKLDGVWTLIDSATVSEFANKYLCLNFYVWKDMSMDISNMCVYKGLADIILINDEPLPPEEDRYTDAEDGALLYKANFAGDEYWKPNKTKGAALAGINYAAQTIVVSPLITDSTRANVDSNIERAYNFWGDKVVGLPLGEGYDYTVKFTLTTNSTTEGLGLLIDGKKGVYVRSTQGCLQNTVVKLDGHEYVNYFGSRDDQEYAIEINGYTIALYVKQYNDAWIKLDEATLTEYANSNLCLSFYTYHDINVDIYDLEVYKGLEFSGNTIPDNDDESTTPDGGEGTTPDGGEGTTPDGGEGTTPDGGEGTTPDGGEGTTPDGGEETTPDGSEGTTPDGDEGTTPEDGDDTENTDTETNVPETEAEIDVKIGCGSSLAMSGVALVGACAAMLAVKRKKED